MGEQLGTDIRSLKRRIRLMLLLDAAETAGLTPIPIIRLHAFAYLSNVLAPVWDLEPLNGKVLKRHGGPFYPELQADLDRLVGFGMSAISDIGYIKEGGRWRLEGKYMLNRDLSQRLLDTIELFNDERRTRTFIQELAFAMSALDIKELDRALLEDATYSDPATGAGGVIDFAEWKEVNASKNAANYFSNFTAEKEFTSPGKKIHLYVRHMYRRIHATG